MEEITDPDLFYDYEEDSYGNHNGYGGDNTPNTGYSNTGQMGYSGSQMMGYGYDRIDYGNFEDNGYGHVDHENSVPSDSEYHHQVDYTHVDNVDFESNFEPHQSQFYHRFPAGSEIKHEKKYTPGVVLDDASIDHHNLKSSISLHSSHADPNEIMLNEIHDYTSAGTANTKLVNPLQRIPSMIDFNNGIVRADIYNNQQDLFNVNAPPNATRVNYSGGSESDFMNIVLNSHYVSGNGAIDKNRLNHKIKNNVVKGTVLKNSESKPKPPEFKDGWHFVADVDPRNKNKTTSNNIGNLNTFIVNPGEKVKFSDVSFPSSKIKKEKPPKIIQ